MEPCKLELGGYIQENGWSTAARGAYRDQLIGVAKDICLTCPVRTDCAPRYTKGSVIRNNIRKSSGDGNTK